MGWKIVFAPQALEQLEEIVRLIAQDNPTAAERFGSYLVERAESLAHFPELGTPYRKRPTCDGLLCRTYFIY
jgi:plasmid stabilization system protein ParE